MGWLDGEMDYIDGHEKSGFKVGQQVRVVCTARTHERGWKNSWEKQMTDMVGEVGTIVADSGSNGFLLKFKSPTGSFFGSCEYPYFVLLDAKLSVRPKEKRTRRGLKVPAFLVCFYDICRRQHRTVVVETFTYGRNGDLHDGEAALQAASRRAYKLSDLKAWIERGYVTRRLPRRVVDNETR